MFVAKQKKRKGESKRTTDNDNDSDNDSHGWDGTDSSSLPYAVRSFDTRKGI
jgi:hypothetical protein